MKHKRIKRGNKDKVAAFFIGSLAATLAFLLFGAITVLIPNRLFIRMTPVYLYDYAFLILTSMLIGAYVGVWHYYRRTTLKCAYSAAGGTVGGLFSFGCALCNKLLIAILGLSGVVSYFLPLQPLLGLLSIALLSFALYMQIKTVLPRGYTE